MMVRRGRDDGFADGQPKTGAALAAGTGFVSAVETLEDVREVFGRDAFAGIGHLEQGAGWLASTEIWISP